MKEYSGPDPVYKLEINGLPMYTQLKLNRPAKLKNSARKNN